MDAYLARTAAVQLVHDALFHSVPDRVKQFIQNLPLLPKDQIPVEDNCPICLVPFIEILNDPDESTADGPEGENCGEKGITRLEVCGHIFCRRDLAEWIRTHVCTISLRSFLFHPPMFVPCSTETAQHVALNLSHPTSFSQIHMPRMTLPLMVVNISRHLKKKTMMNSTVTMPYHPKQNIGRRSWGVTNTTSPQLSQTQ
ncbi:hypothetical protein P691DRAFT_223682 [Macrolepiota fuliginosa MF-IS2]|uniref:RING-type domain-containing protein n=1 Tax=Macrolepiota fuliginosa MF-IS2 TaxID=1400762 RepID=A0A9P5XNT5_9AGAR|nr:hypothetical protein P691DRAFT_223682 [Macrolepiota fuliginosa MF-IS2]